MVNGVAVGALVPSSQNLPKTFERFQIDSQLFQDAEE